MQLSYLFNQGFARLKINGIPDLSLGHSPETLGIIISWKLELIGFHQLEGKKDHLCALIDTVMTYSRYSISGITRSVGNNSSLISISPVQNSHQLILRSTKEGVAPLKIMLDDAELCDLTRCLDQVRLDSKIAIDWGFSLNNSLSKRDFYNPLVSLYKLAILLIASASFVVTAMLFLLIPLSTEIPNSSDTIDNIQPSPTDKTE